MRGVEHAPGQQRGRLRVVGGQRAVGEVVLVAGVEEQLRVLGLSTSSRAASMSPSPTKIGSASIRGSAPARRPARPEPNSDDRDAGIEEQRAARAGPCLRELLRREHAEREAGVDEPGGQPVGGRTPRSSISSEPICRRRPCPPRCCRRCGRRTDRACARCARPPQLVGEGATPGVSPCAWWNSSTSAMAGPYPVRNRVKQHGQDPAVVGLAGGQAQLGEDCWRCASRRCPGPRGTRAAMSPGGRTHYDRGRRLLGVVARAVPHRDNNPPLRPRSRERSITVVGSQPSAEGPRCVGIRLRVRCFRVIISPQPRLRLGRRGPRRRSPQDSKSPGGKASRARED